MVRICDLFLDKQKTKRVTGDQKGKINRGDEEKSADCVWSSLLAVCTAHIADLTAISHKHSRVASLPARVKESLQSA